MPMIVFSVYMFLQSASFVVNLHVSLLLGHFLPKLEVNITTHRGNKGGKPFLPVSPRAHVCGTVFRTWFKAMAQVYSLSFYNRSTLGPIGRRLPLDVINKAMRIDDM